MKCFPNLLDPIRLCCCVSSEVSGEWLTWEKPSLSATGLPLGLLVPGPAGCFQQGPVHHMARPLWGCLPEGLKDKPDQTLPGLSPALATEPRLAWVRLLERCT